MNTCVKCGSSERQVKKGFTPSGSQRYQCQQCGATYTPSPKEQGYETATRQQVLRLYLEGNGIRRIARLVGVSHTSVMNWTAAAAAQLPEAPVPEQVVVMEGDELFTFVGTKKTKFM